MIGGPGEGSLQFGGDGMRITVFGFMVRSVGIGRSVKLKQDVHIVACMQYISDRLLCKVTNLEFGV